MAVLISIDETEICTSARIVLGAVAPLPVRALQSEEFLQGKRQSEVNAEETARLAVAGARPLSKNAYKLEIAKALVKRAVRNGTAQMSKKYHFQRYVVNGSI